MKSNKMIQNLLENWPTKVFSLLVAIGLYLVVSLFLVGSKKVEIPLEIIHPIGYEAVSTLDESVELIIRADQRYVSLINSSAIQAVADFSFVDSEGVASTRVQLMYKEELFNIDFSLSTNPEIIKVFYQEKDREDSPVDEVLL